MHISNKGPVFRIFKVSLQVNNKKNYPVKKMGKRFEQNFFTLGH